MLDQWRASASLDDFSALDAISEVRRLEDKREQSMHIVTAIDDKSCTPTPTDVQILGKANPNPASESLLSALRTLPGQIITATSTDIVSLPELSVDGKVCICLAELEGSVLDHCNDAEWSSIQKMLSSASQVLWITCGGAMDVEYAEAGLTTGLARSARSDNEALWIITLDLDPQQKSAEDTAKIVLKILHASLITRAEAPSREFEYVERGGRVYIPRLVEDQSLQAYLTASTTQPETELQPLFQHDRPLHLEIESPGLLDSIRFVEDETPQKSLGTDELRMDLRASGVNFRM